MMCKCCDGNNASCGCFHHKSGLWHGLLFVVLGGLWYATNYGYLDKGLWQWLLPALVVLWGLKWAIFSGKGEGKK